MLVPKRVKHRKVQRGSMKGNAKGGTTLNHGTWGVQALDRHWITNRLIEAALIAMTRRRTRTGNVGTLSSQTSLLQQNLLKLVWVKVKVTLRAG